MRRKPGAKMGMQRLGRAIQKSLKGDRKRRVEEVGTAIEGMLKEDLPDAKGAWRRMKGWYRAAVTGGPPPARATFERITADQTELYRQVPSPGGRNPNTHREPRHR